MISKNLPHLLNVTALEGDDLDFWLLVALGYMVRRTSSSITTVLQDDGTPFIEAGDPCAAPHVKSFCRQWEAGGPLIEALHISLAYATESWTASFQGFKSTGPTPLVAAMRAIVERFIRSGSPIFALEKMSKFEHGQVYLLISPLRPNEWFRQNYLKKSGGQP